jgi:hypothetical protein
MNVPITDEDHWLLKAKPLTSEGHWLIEIADWWRLLSDEGWVLNWEPLADEEYWRIRLKMMKRAYNKENKLYRRISLGR